MAYDTNPTAEYIPDFAKGKKTEFGGQDKVDAVWQDLYMKHSLMAAAEPKSVAGQAEIKPVYSGFAGISIDRNAAALAASTFLRVNPRSNDEKDKAKADSLLEPWLSGAWQLSQVGDVWGSQVRDLPLFGRGWSNFFPLPRLWAEKEYLDLLEELKEALEGEDDEKIAKLHGDISDYKRNNWPLRWRHTQARGTWPQFSDERWLPEVVEIRKMKLGQIRAEYGDEFVPGPRQSDNSTAELDVYVYANWVWTATVIGDKDDPKMAHKWDHNLGMSPYILLEANRQPQNDSGIIWKSCIQDYRHMIELEDEILTDARHAHRLFTLSPLVFSLNKEQRGLDIQTTARPEDQIDYRPGEPIYLWEKETLTLGPQPQLNEQSGNLLNFTHDYNTNILLTPVLMGHLPSGTSGIGFEAARQAATKNQDPYSKGVQRAGKHWAKLAFRSVKRLSEEFSEVSDDKLVVVDEKHGELKVGPSDVKGWESYVQVRLDEPMPLSENQQMGLAQMALGMPLHPEYVLGRWLNIENASEKVDDYYVWQLEQALIQSNLEAVAVRAGEIQQQAAAPNMGELAQRIAGAPPAMQMGLLMAGAPGTEQVPPEILQAYNNMARTGTPQNMSQTAAQGIGTVGGQGGI